MEFTYMELFLNLVFLLILVLNITPLYIFYLNHNKSNFIPFFELTHLFFLFCYTIPLIADRLEYLVFYRSDHYTLSSLLGESYSLLSLSGVDLLDTMTIFFLSLLLFNLGYFLTTRTIKQKSYKFNFFGIEKKNSSILIIGIISFVCYLFLQYFSDQIIFLNKLKPIKLPLMYLFISCFYLHILQSKKYLNYLIFILVVSVPLLNEMLTGLIFAPAFIVLFIYLLNFLYKKKFHLFLIFILLIIFTTLSYFKESYRASLVKNVKEFSLKDKNSIVQTNHGINKYKLFVNSYVNSYKNNFSNYDLKEKIFKIYFKTFDRLSHSYESLIIVRTKTPNEVPYFFGKSYKNLLTKPIPRILWPNKPQEVHGNKFGRAYKILNEQDFNTSWNMPIISEFYANFAIPGVAIGMFLIGIFFGLLYSLLNFNKHNILFVVTLISFYPIFFLEVNLSILIGLNIQVFLFLILFISTIKYSLKILNK